jgi:hypothetical protein
VTHNPYQTPNSDGSDPPEFLAARAKVRDRILLVLTALGIFGSIMAVTIVCAIFRVFG